MILEALKGNLPTEPRTERRWFKMHPCIRSTTCNTLLAGIRAKLLPPKFKILGHETGCLTTHRTRLSFPAGQSSSSVQDGAGFMPFEVQSEHVERCCSSNALQTSGCTSNMSAWNCEQAQPAKQECASWALSKRPPDSTDGAIRSTEVTCLQANPGRRRAEASSHCDLIHKPRGVP